MRHKFKFTLIVLFFISHFVYSQCSTFERVYTDNNIGSSDRGIKIIPVSTGGYLVLGKHKYLQFSPTLSLRKIDDCGNEIWVRYFSGGDPSARDPVSLIELKDGSFLFGLTTLYWYGAITITKVDSSGQFQWSKKIGDDTLQNIFVLSIATLPSDSGFYILGKIFSSTEQNDIFIEKRSINGDSLWRKYYLLRDTFPLAWPEQKMLGVYNDSCLMVCGGYHGSPFLYKVNSQGDSLSCFFFPDSSAYRMATNWAWTSDSAIVMAGIAFSSAGYLGYSVVIKSDILGNKIWEKKLYNVDIDYRSVGASTDSGVYVAQYSSSCNTDGNCLIKKLDVNGDSVWLQCYGSPIYSTYSTVGQGVIRTTDNGFIFVASADTAPLTGGALPHLIYVVKVDSLGNIISTLNIDGNTSAANEINIYPNPTTNTFTIKNISTTEKSLLQISNPLGEIVYTTTLTEKEQTINAKLVCGIYFVRVGDGEKSVVRKLVIQ